MRILLLILTLLVLLDAKKKKKKKTKLNVPKLYLKRNQADAYCKVCLHVVSEAKKYLSQFANHPPLDMAGGRIGANGKKIHKYVAYNQSEVVVDEAFDDVCAKSEFQGFTEKNEEAKFRLMVGKTITMKSLSGESLKTGQGDTVKNMCHNVIDRHEDDLTKFFRAGAADKIDSACQMLLRMKECPLLSGITHDELYASYTIEDKEEL